MLFASEHNLFTSLKLYCTDSYISIGSLECNLINNHLIPFAGSAIDNSFSMALIKLYNEMLERTRVGFNTFNPEECTAINLLDGSVKKVKRVYLGYGYNERLGFMDTTGTASGQSSRRTIEKAINELLEKNELGVFWYKGLGKALDINEQLKGYLAKKGVRYESGNIRIFIANNISSRFTVIVILFDEDKKVLSTGVSSNKDIVIALNDAIMEAHLIKHNFLLKRVEKEHLKDSTRVYIYVEKLYKELEKVDIFQEEIKVSDRPGWFCSLECALLNNKMWQKEITLRVFSDDLINCLPTKKNIEQCNNTIVRVYNLKDNDDVPECIVV